MGYLDNVKFKKGILKLQQKVRIHSQIGRTCPATDGSTTFVVYTTKSGGVRDKYDWDTYIAEI